MHSDSDFDRLIEGLNKRQLEAVTAQPGPLLVLAGAGSGKTRVLTLRAAWLIKKMRLPLSAIMAVTFTNKAAREMRERILTFVGAKEIMGALMIGTFHSIAHQMLRRNAAAANLPSDFVILDSQDQLRMVKQILAEQKVSESMLHPRQGVYFINDHKERGLRSAQCDSEHPQLADILKKMYKSYEALCERTSVVDFTELLLRCCEMLEAQNEVKEYYARRISHLLIDEFQDTNSLQMRMIQLMDDKRNVMAVGDDDQSIYSWRGAKVEHMLDFKRTYPDAHIVRLEQNYRSTHYILEAANALINHNKNRLGKNLWTDSDKGDLIDVFDANNEYDEASYLISDIKEHANQGAPLLEHAILYRTNTQSRVIEQQLMESGLPYRVYGGLRFFDRQEIRDLIAYLQLIRNHHADHAWSRIINLPARGLGAKTMQTLSEVARQEQCSLWEAAKKACEYKLLKARALSTLGEFLESISELGRELDPNDISGAIEKVVHRFMLKEHYIRLDPSERGRERGENLDELINAGRDFRPLIEEGESLIDTFLSHAALETGESQAKEGNDCVQLMTIHAAKGLEFDSVYLTGMEEELFPNQRAIDDPWQLDEERRLCYVGITRARKRLCLSFAYSRALYGRRQYRTASRFIAELPKELLNTRSHNAFTEQHYQTPSINQAKSGQSAAKRLRPGAEIQHPSFGRGMIIRISNQTGNASVLINFYDHGEKWILSEFIESHLSA